MVTPIKPRVKAVLPEEGDSKWLMKEEVDCSEGKTANT